LSAAAAALEYHAEDLTAASAKAAGNVGQASTGFKDQAALLAEIADRMTAQLKEAGHLLGQRSDDLDRIARRASGQVDDAASMLSQRSAEIAARADGAVADLGRVAEVIGQRSAEVTATADQSATKLTRMGDMVRQRTQEAASKAEDVSARMEAATDAMRHHLQELATRYDQTERAIATLGETLLTRADEVDRVSQRAIDGVAAWDDVVQTHAETLGTTSERIAGHARQINETFARQANEMKETTRRAEELLKLLNERRRQVGMDDFLRSATFVTERLQSIAVDLNRLLEISINEDDWRRYNRGEKGLFVRKMLGFRERSRLAAITQKYQDEGDFREYVTRYVSQFEGLIAEAKRRDPEGVLGTTFLSSDIGKVYMLLARAIGRDV
jgi:methyl-accepting chemotaxis protein